MHVTEINIFTGEGYAGTNKTKRKKRKEKNQCSAKTNTVYEAYCVKNLKQID